MKRILTISLTAVALSALVLLAFRYVNDSGNIQNVLPKGNTNAIRRSASRHKQTDVAASSKAASSRQSRTAGEWHGIYDHLSPADRALGEAMQEALDRNNFKDALSAAMKALGSNNKELRLDAVDALSWFGQDAIPELTSLMADKDDDVAEAARNSWELGLNEIESAESRLKFSLAALKVLSNEDSVSTIGGQFTNAALELIDDEHDEQKSMQKRIEIVQELVTMIEGENSPKTKLGKELYEDLTGNEWISIEEAELYLRDPDNYELPEDNT